MQAGEVLESILKRWGEQLLRPGLRRYGRPGKDLAVRAPTGAMVRAGLKAIVRKSPEVMVKVTGGGRGMGAIKAHLSYISRRGEFALENQDGLQILGKDNLSRLAEEWKYGFEQIPNVSHRREAFHVMLSMPPETDAQVVLAAARVFARQEFSEHKHAFVLHDPATDPDSHRPHVHLIIRAQGANGKRLNPRKADLVRWRQSFADRLMERGVAASATRRQTRGVLRPPKKLMEYHAPRNDIRRPMPQPSERARLTEDDVLVAWQQVTNALMESPAADDRALGQEALAFVSEMPALVARSRSLPRGVDFLTENQAQRSPISMSEEKNCKPPDHGVERGSR